MTHAASTLHPKRWQSVVDLATGWCETRQLPCIAIMTGTAETVTGRLLVTEPQREQQGELRGDQSVDLHEDAIFLVASITKPVVATALMMLVERGLLTLGDRVVDWIPEFGCEGKYGVEVRHLLTHTSGLPDMLPDNRELRQSHASLERFVERVCQEPLAFPPGRGVQYQSMGYAILGEMIARLTGKTCAEFLQQELFQPLGMSDTSLGAPDTWFQGPAPQVDRIPPAIVPADHASGTDWNWNSRYWRQLGAPWGGMLTSAADLAKFAQFLLRGGTTSAEVSADPSTRFEKEDRDRGRSQSPFSDPSTTIADAAHFPALSHPKGGAVNRLLASATIAASTRNQLTYLRDVPEDDRRCRPWGLGWRLNWPAHSANFGDLLGPNTYGHWGATGTVLWIDPDRGHFALILTTLPQEPSGKYLSRLSNGIAAAWE